MFAHHTLETMNQAASPFPPGDNPPPPTRASHLGEARRQQRVPAAARRSTRRVKCLFLRHPTVIGFVTGHEHRNRVRAVPRSA